MGTDRLRSACSRSAAALRDATSRMLWAYSMDTKMQLYTSQLYCMLAIYIAFLHPIYLYTIRTIRCISICDSVCILPYTRIYINIYVKKTFGTACVYILKMDFIQHMQIYVYHIIHIPILRYEYMTAYSPMSYMILRTSIHEVNTSITVYIM